MVNVGSLYRAWLSGRSTCSATPSGVRAASGQQLFDIPTMLPTPPPSSQMITAKEQVAHKFAVCQGPPSNVRRVPADKVLLSLPGDLPMRYL